LRVVVAGVLLERFNKALAVRVVSHPFQTTHGDDRA
jgi:hypothetical protein